MLGKPFRLLVILSALGVIPYAWFDQRTRGYVRQQFASIWGPQRETFGDYSTFELPASSVSGPSTGLLSTGSNQLRPGLNETPRPTDVLGDVLRFDIDERWVLARWPRVSTVLSDQNRKGLRVTLVTGTRLSDLAGSLSYYFDAAGVVRRIAFEGTTGDADEMVRFAVDRFGMRPEPTLGAGLLLTRWNGRPSSGLQIRHAAVVRAEQPRSQLEVHFEINRPGAGYGLSAHFQQLLREDRLNDQALPPRGIFGG